MLKKIDFERLLNILIDDRVDRLSLRAVSGDKIMAERLTSWMKSSRGKKHIPLIRKLSKQYEDPKKLCYVFFVGIMWEGYCA